MPPFPPSPWRLRATVHLSIWWVKVAEVGVGLPEGTRALGLLGRVPVVGAWLVYEPGGVLCYNELAVIVPTRHRKGIGATITEIWVDSPVSMEGGRELWGIPKELAIFDVRRGGEFVATAKEADEGSIASFRFRKRFWLPGTWPLKVRIAQRLRGALVLTPLKARGRVSVGRGVWEIPSGSQLARLADRRPFLSLAVPDAEVSFGE